MPQTSVDCYKHRMGKDPSLREVGWREEHRGKVEEGFAEVVKNIKDNRILKRNYLPVKQQGKKRAFTQRDFNNYESLEPSLSREV